MKAIITGASGMIGSSLIDLLVKKGYECYAIVRPNSNKLANINLCENVKIVECDIDNILNLPNLIQDNCDVFFNFAWKGVFGSDRNLKDLQLSNVKNSLNAIRCAKELGCIKFVGAGSQAEYGIVEEDLTPNTATNPITEYGKAKLLAFNEGVTLAKNLGLDFYWGRILSAYGPRDNEYTMVKSILKKMIKGESCPLTDCTQIWDFIYESDVALDFYLIMEKGKPNLPYPIGSGKSKMLKDYVIEMANTVQSTSQLQYGKLGASKIKRLCASIEQLKIDTGFSPCVSFSEGIKIVADKLRD